MFRSRARPALIATAVVGGGIYWQTRGGTVQPTSQARNNPREEGLSETLSTATGVGGRNSRDPPAPGDSQPRTQTRIYSNTPDTPSKKNPEKARNGGEEELGPVNTMQAGKHAGDREMDLNSKNKQ